MNDDTSSVRSAQEVRRQLADLAEVKESALEFGTPDFASQLSLDSLLAHEQELLDELHAAELLESPADAEFSLGGEPIAEHDVPASLLGDLLKHLQTFVYAVAQVQVGRTTSRGSVAQSIVSDFRLLVMPETLPGSFRFRVRLPKPQESDAPLDTTPSSVLQLACDALTQAEDEQLAELLSHKRARTSFSGIVTLLAKSNCDFAARYRQRPRATRLYSQEARRRLDWLGLLQVSEETTTLTGELVGASIEKRKFELKTRDELLSGSILESAVEQLRQFHFGDRVQVHLRVVTTEHEETFSEPSTTYQAESFAPPPDESEEGD